MKVNLDDHASGDLVFNDDMARAVAAAVVVTVRGLARGSEFTELEVLAQFNRLVNFLRAVR